MTRTDDDSWDIEQSVGATALATAAIRAEEARAKAPLYDDPFAQYFLDAATERGWQEPYPQATVAELAESDPALGTWMQAMTNWAHCRTRFVDDFFTAAAAKGIRQVVIVAAGLDARAWRMSWPSGTVIYEIDQPGVLEFKAATLRSHDAAPVVGYVGVPIDLRLDWPSALQEAGFDASQSTAWSVEGLLPYLTADAQDTFFERMQTLSAPGSGIALDAYTAEFYGQQNIKSTSERMGTGAVSTDAIDPGQLIFAGARADVAQWLSDHDWDCSTIWALDLMTRLGRRAAPGIDTTSMSSNFIVGWLATPKA